MRQWYKYGMVLNHMDITYDIKGGQVTVEWTFEDKKMKTQND